MDLLDTESVFVPGYGYDHDDKYNRLTKSFHKTRNCEKCLGNAKTDTYEMVVTGLNEVNWGNKTPKKCFSSIKHGFVGVKNDPQFNADRRVTVCASIQNLNKIHNKKDWPNDSIKGLKCQRMPNQVSLFTIFGS